MLDIPRHLPLDSGSAPVAPLPPATRFVLRIRDAETNAPTMAAGFDLSGSINTVTGDEHRFASRLGPDEWLLVAPPKEAETIASALATDLADRFHAAIDVSHRNAAIGVSGAHARTILNGGIPLDLDDAAFPEGSATRTICAKAEVVLVRPVGGAGWRVECWRSFAPYVQAFLSDVAKEFA